MCWADSTCLFRRHCWNVKGRPRTDRPMWCTYPGPAISPPSCGLPGPDGASSRPSRRRNRGRSRRMLRCTVSSAGRGTSRWIQVERDVGSNSAHFVKKRPDQDSLAAFSETSSPRKAKTSIRHTPVARVVHAAWALIVRVQDEMNSRTNWSNRYPSQQDEAACVPLIAASASSSCCMTHPKSGTSPRTMSCMAL